MAQNTNVKRPRGRPKGALNKINIMLKDAILDAAAQAGAGEDGRPNLVNYLRKMAKQEPASFLPLLGKVLPTQLTGKDDGPVEVRHSAEVQEADQFLTNELARLTERTGKKQDTQEDESPTTH